MAIYETYLTIKQAATRLYTYLPKDNTAAIDGLLSTALTENGWKKYRGRTGKETKEDVLKVLDSWEPEWNRSRAISVLSQPIPIDAAEDLRQFANESELYSFDLDDLIKANLVKNLRKTNSGPGTYAVDGLSKDRFNWNRKPKKLTFYGIPHYMVETTEGRIPPEFIRKEPKAINFPEEELANLKGKDHFYTTRVSSDYDNYNLGDTVTTPWGDAYDIVSEDKYNNLKDHKFYDELTDEQKRLLATYKKIKLLGLTKKSSVDISNIVNAYKNQYGFDLSHMKGKHSNKPRYNNGKVADDIPVDAYGGSWAKNNTIYLNPNMDAVAKYYGIADATDLQNTIIAHELAHEIYKRQATQEFIKQILEEAKKKKFTTPYLTTVPEHKLNEETFCEYLANGLNKKASKLYTYVDPEADLSLGLLALRNVPEDAAIRRYGRHVKDPKNLNKEYIVQQVDSFAPGRPDWIYGLDAPIPDYANEGLIRFRNARKLVSWDPEEVKDLVKIIRKYHTRRTREEVPPNFEPLKRIQWSRIPKDRTAFRYAPIYKVLTESGRIPPELLNYE